MPSILFGQKATPVQRTAHCSYDVEFINIGNVAEAQWTEYAVNSDWML